LISIGIKKKKRAGQASKFECGSQQWSAGTTSQPQLNPSKSKQGLNQDQTWKDLESLQDCCDAVHQCSSSFMTSHDMWLSLEGTAYKRNPLVK
jgi:hypothetical protein